MDLNKPRKEQIEAGAQALMEAFPTLLDDSSPPSGSARSPGSFWRPPMNSEPTEMAGVAEAETQARLRLGAGRWCRRSPNATVDASGAPLAEGTPFGKYRLVALLGHGGMGEVWRAVETATDRIVALKVLPAHMADDERFQARFRREARVAASLTEPHVVPVHSR